MGRKKDDEDEEEEGANHDDDVAPSYTNSKREPMSYSYHYRRS